MWWGSTVAVKGNDPNIYTVPVYPDITPRFSAPEERKTLIRNPHHLNDRNIIKEHTKLTSCLNNHSQLVNQILFNSIWYLSFSTCLSQKAHIPGWKNRIIPTKHEGFPASYVTLPEDTPWKLQIGHILKMMGWNG